MSAPVRRAKARKTQRGAEKASKPKQINAKHAQNTAGALPGEALAFKSHFGVGYSDLP